MDNNIDILIDLFFVLSKNLAEESFHSVSYKGLADSFGNGDPKPSFAKTISQGKKRKRV